MEDKLLYHITDYRNLPSILENGALAAHSQVSQNGITYKNIAYTDVRSRRSVTKVPVSPYGVLHDYVPFYFAPKSPMLYSIKNGGVENYSGKQSDLIYLVTRTDKINSHHKAFVFTDGHAIMALTEFYNDLKELDEIDWQVMESKYWFDNEENPDRKRRRQAEFLIRDRVELHLFLGIGVYDQTMAEKVKNMLAERNIEMMVLIRPNFYY